VPAISGRTVTYRDGVAQAVQAGGLSEQQEVAAG
jgi:hypothetical protein